MRPAAAHGSAGGDIAKLAVMPNDELDVLRLMEASLRAHRQMQIPPIAMLDGIAGHAQPHRRRADPFSRDLRQRGKAQCAPDSLTPLRHARR